jgi:5-methylcytosine-specific restriction endonuclease McrA
MKTCSKCGEEKSLETFSKNKGKRDGLNSYCKPCMRSYKKVYNQQDHVKEQARASSLKWHYANREESIAKSKAYHTANREAVNERQRKYYDDNLPYMLQRASVGRGERAKRVVSWANQQVIDAYYMEAKRLEELTGIQFHVDHIIPLQGKMVSGLHVETNLQLLPAHENLGKKNSFDPETFNA